MGLFDFFKKRIDESIKAEEREIPKDSGSDDFTKELIQTASFFVEKTSKKFSGLDYSIDSLKVLDEALDEASDFYDDMTEAMQKNLIKTAGSYIFEVARTNFGGSYFWYDQLDQPILVTGQPEFEMSLLAFEKVKGRLENGAEDNIPFFFEGFANGVKEKQSQLIV
jgi:hypothetical protein